jgi:hypothetical protein
MVGRSAVACLYVLMLANSAHAAPVRNFNVAGWTAGVYTDRSGKFTHCAASFRYDDSGVTVIFSVNRSYNWAMGLFRPGADLKDGGRVDLGFTIGTDQPFPVRGIARGTDLLEISFEDSSLFARFSRGYHVTITDGKRAQVFDLTSASQVLPALVTCVTSQLNGGRNQPATPAPRQPSNDAVRAEAARLAANLLSHAGIVGFTLLEPDELDELKADAAWKTDSVLGTVVVAPELAAEQMPAIAIGADAKICKGTFFSGSLPEESGIGARVFTTCQTGNDNITVYYLSVPRRTGGIYVVAIASSGGEQPAKEADADIRKAVLRLR